MNNKFEFADESKIVHGKTVRRIRALRSFGNVQKGELGGFIQFVQNLSNLGTCWIYQNATVFGKAKVQVDARVYGNAKVYGYTHIHGNAEVFGDAIICGADIRGNAQVHGHAFLERRVSLRDNAIICGNVTISGEYKIGGNSIIDQDDWYMHATSMNLFDFTIQKVQHETKESC